ncbi:MAG: hypothetical protein VZQ61_04200 [Christensenellaceae bacterium]
MKNFTDTLKLFFVFCGAVLGAGFLSGGELVGFFGSRSLICLLISGTLFFMEFAFIGGARDRFTKVAYLIADGVFASAMLSGLDEIAWQTGALNGFPAVSLLSLVLFHFFLSGSIVKLEKANCVLMPLSVAAIFAAAVIADPVTAPNVNAGAKDAVNAVLYACMNLFVALPSVSIAAKSKKKCALIAAALVFAAFFVAFSYLILRVSPSTALPLIDMARGTPLYAIIVVAVFIGSFTSLLCYLYPLKSLISEKTADKKRRNLYCFLLYALLFLLSRAGIAAIIKYFYPLVGALGLFSIVKSFFRYKKKGERRYYGKKERVMSKKKKTKIKKLTEEEYGNYLMALKDEVPPAAVRKLQKDK